jgi:putative transposase
MADMTTMDAMELVRKHLDAAGADQLREMVKLMAEGLMDAEAQALCGAQYGVPSADRVNQRNGYRARRWDTRVGSIELAVPKLRKGSYFPEWLLRARKRSEQALMGVVAECYLQGVSTRKVDAVVQQLGIEGISKSQVSELAAHLDGQVEAFRHRRLDAEAYPYVWLDAMYVKSREDGRIANVATIVATGVNAQGYREILGMDVITAEDGAGWTAFLRGLVARGLKGVKLVISDSHEGLKAAIAATLPGASWQRCRTHYMRNLLTRVPKSAQGMVATLVRSIFAQPDAEAVWSAHSGVVQQLDKRFPEAAKLLDETAAELLAFTAFPKAHWKQIWSNNPQERLNKELRRRSDVVGIFPNRAAIIRLLGAVLAEQHDEWAVTRRYLTVGPLDALVQSRIGSEEQERLPMTA